MSFPVHKIDGNKELRAHFEEIGLLSLLTTEGEYFTDIGKLTSWLQTAPKFTTYRVNTLLTTPISVVEILDEELRKQADGRLGKPRPPWVSIHPLIDEVVMVGGWNQRNLCLTPRPLEVVVDAACGAAVMRGAHVFAAGVMGMLAGVHSGDLVSVYADVKNNCRRGLLSIFPAEDRVFVGNGIARMERSELFGRDLYPRGVAVEMTDPVSGCPALGDLPPLFSALLQNLPSVVCGLSLCVRPGDTVLDMCAAPGNKTSHLAAIMQDQGLIVALDKTESKVKAIRRRCKQFGITCVRAFAFDSTKAASKPCPEDERVLNVEDGPPFPPETFDRVLLDAPCSGLGQRPLLASRATRKHIESYPPLQKALFHTAVSLLRRGGSLVYSTCTITVAENEGMVSWALETFPSLALVPALPVIGWPGWSGSDLDEQHRKCVQRFGPPPPGSVSHPDHDSVGFFIAHFVKG